MGEQARQVQATRGTLKEEAATRGPVQTRAPWRCSPSPPPCQAPLHSLRSEDQSKAHKSPETCIPSAPHSQRGC